MKKTSFYQGSIAQPPHDTRESSIQKANAEEHTNMESIQRSVKKDQSSGVITGKLDITIPKSLHCELLERANNEGVSLNQYIIYKLSR